MGRKSTKEDKNIYQTSREDLGLTRDEAGAMMEYVTADRIEKIENEKSLAHPEEILAMSECYRMPELCNYYCSHECPIGRRHVPAVEVKELSQITLEILAGLNALDREKSRLIEITVDGRISPAERPDFDAISEQLSQVSRAVSSLKLWVDKAIALGDISES